MGLLSEDQLKNLKWPTVEGAEGAEGAEGDLPPLLPLVAQNMDTGAVLMVGYVSFQSLEETCKQGKLVFFSRSKRRLWLKGETSGHFLHVESLHVDCDGDTLLAMVRPHGPACHRNTLTCFDEISSAGVSTPLVPRAAVFADLYQVLQERLLESNTEDTSGTSSSGSYTQKLYKAGLDRILRKVVEESGEFLVASKNWERTGDAREMVSEAVDVFYHMLVGLNFSQVPFSEFVEEIQRRVGKRRENATLERKI